MNSRLKLTITSAIFEELADSEKEFAKKVRVFYTDFCRGAGYEPAWIDARLDDAWVAFQRDKQDVRKSLPKGSPGGDHFKLCGILVYWLRRYAPVADMRDLSMNIAALPGADKLQPLLQKYPSELPAFEMGLTICDFFAENAANGGTDRPGVDLDYYEAVCYLMKFKSISPHSMGMIYRSLFVELAPRKTQ